MNPILKKIISVAAFICIALIIPTIILLIFFDASTQFSVYAIVYALIIFGVFGYVIIAVKQMQSDLNDALDEIKMQNAAIAYKISNNSEASSESVPVAPVETTTAPVDTSSIPLNPAEPLAMPSTKKVVKATDDGFDDFK